MEKYQYITLREKPNLKNSAAEGFNCKWKVPIEAYLECMEAYLQNETEYGWYLCNLINSLFSRLLFYILTLKFSFVITDFDLNISFFELFMLFAAK